MSDLELEPLPPDVRRLLDAERPIPSAPPGLAASVLGALEPKLPAASPALAPPSGSAVAPLAHAASGMLTRVVIAALAFGAGAGTMRFIDRNREPAVVAVPQPPVAPAKPVEPAPSPLRGGSLSEEQALIDQARAGLLRGNSADALAALEAHQQRFAGGQLEEDREALWVQALASAGRDDDAQKRAAQFRVRWPRSILLPVVDAATVKKK